MCYRPHPMSKAKAKAEIPSLVVASRVHDILKERDLRVAGDAFDALNAEVEKLIEDAAKRASANGRKTVQAHDFSV